MSLESSENGTISPQAQQRAAQFQQALDKRAAQKNDRSAWKRSKKIFRKLAPVLGASAADISRIHRDNVENYEEAIQSTYDCWDYFTYPRLLVRNTIMKWLIGSENILESEVWKYLVRESLHQPSPKILFQTKPDDVWVLMLDDLSHTASLRPTIVIPTKQDGRNAVIISIDVFLKERENDEAIREEN